MFAEACRELLLRKCSEETIDRWIAEAHVDADRIKSRTNVKLKTMAANAGG